MGLIDVGSPAINRATGLSPNKTLILRDNPANANGTIDTIELWAYENLSDCKVATFYCVSGDNYSTRDTYSIGSVTAGAKRTYSGLSIDVQSGDLIGIYYSAGKMEQDLSGYNDIGYIAGDHIPCTNQTFNFAYVDDTLSLYAKGTSLVAFNVILMGANF